MVGGGGEAYYQALRIVAGFSLWGSLQIVCFVIVNVFLGSGYIVATFQKLKENCVGTSNSFLKPGIFGIQYPGSKKKFGVQI